MGRPDSGTRRSSTAYRELIALRRGSAALARGGIRYAAVTPDAIAYLREHGRRAAALPRRAVGARADPARRSARSRRGSRPCTAATLTFDGSEVVLPGDGPAFHVWRLEEYDG